MSLVGKFFFHCGKEYTQTGEVVDQLTPEVVVVKFDHCEHVPPSLTVLSISSMVSKMKPDGAVDGDWEIFNSRAELDTWLEWLDPPTDKEATATTAAAPVH